MPAPTQLQALSHRLFQIMLETDPTNLGPEHSGTNNEYDDLYRAVSWFSHQLGEEGPLLVGDALNRANVLAVVSGVNRYFHEMLEDPMWRGLFDDLYNFYADTYDWPM